MFRAVSLSLAAIPLSLFGALPTSETYTLPTYTFSNGGGTNSSANYQLESTVGGAGGSPGSTNYVLPIGIRASTTAKVPAAPAFTNPDSSYDRLKIVLTVTGHPSDAKYAIAISNDGFATTQYVQPDLTVSNTFTVANYQSYAAWGGVSGTWINTLANSTTYTVRVASLQGSDTGSAFGPTASASTSTPTVTFGLSTSLTGTPPFNATFASLTPGSVIAADATITSSLTTNAEDGGELQLKSQNAGLTSTTKTYTLSSATADLTAAVSGYGAQVSSVSQSSGGPLAAVSPYNGTSSTVGGVTTMPTPFARFSTPIASGSATFSLLAKTSAVVPAAADYADVLTITLLLSF